MFAEHHNLAGKPLVEVVEQILDMLNDDIDAINDTYRSAAGGYCFNAVPYASMRDVEHFLERLPYSPFKEAVHTVCILTSMSEWDAEAHVRELLNMGKTVDGIIAEGNKMMGE